MGLCGGNTTVWAFVDTGAGTVMDYEGAKTKAQNDFSKLQWVHLSHLDNWNIVPDRQEAPRKRTSSTAGAARKFCPDILSFDIELTSTLDPVAQWLYGAILSNAVNINVGVKAWFFLGFGPEYAPEGAGSAGPQLEPGGGDGGPNGRLRVVDGPPVDDHSVGHQGQTNNNAGFALYREEGFYVYGQVNPPGITLENDGQDPATGDWTITVQELLSPTPDHGAPNVIWNLGASYTLN